MNGTVPPFVTALVVHLETDASINRALPSVGPDGGPRWLAGGGIVLRSSTMRLLRSDAILLGYVGSPLEAESRALLQGLRTAKAIGASVVLARTDSRPLADALNGVGRFRTVGLVTLQLELMSALGGFEAASVKWLPSSHGRTRGDGVDTPDHLARQAAELPTRTELRRLHRHRQAVTRRLRLQSP